MSKACFKICSTQKNPGTKSALPKVGAATKHRPRGFRKAYEPLKTSDLWHVLGAVHAAAWRNLTLVRPLNFSSRRAIGALIPAWLPLVVAGPSSRATVLAGVPRRSYPSRAWAILRWLSRNALSSPGTTASSYMSIITIAPEEPATMCFASFFPHPHQRPHDPRHS